MIVHVTRTSDATVATTDATTATTAATDATTVAATAATAFAASITADDRHRQMIGIMDELNGSMRLLRCAATGRLVKQGVSMTHLHVLWLLEEHGELPMSRVAELLDVSLSNATGLADRMVERGLVERVRVPDDRRVVLIRLTAAGQAALEDIQIMRQDLTLTILERLDDGQLERLHASLHDLRTAIRAEADANADLFEAHHRHPNQPHPGP
jgi:DNA-binding MarR family transcriptional regulator